MLSNRVYFLLAVLSIMMLLPGVAKLPMVDRDSALFSQASKQMIESGNYWQIYFQEKQRHRKPPGYYWLQSASVQLTASGDLNKTTPYRLPAFLCSILCILCLSAFTNQIYGKQTAYLAGLILMSSMLFVFETIFAATDPVLLLSVILIQGSLWYIYQRSPQGLCIPLSIKACFWLGLAFGIVVKGVAPIYPTLTILALLAYDRSGQWLKDTGATWGLPLCMALTLAWLIPLSIHTNSNFLWDMLRIDFLPKLVSGTESHAAPPGYYFIFAHAAFWPFSILFWPMIHWFTNNRHKHSDRFLLFWVIANWVAIELTPTKLPGYFLPILPALAIMAARVICNAPINTLKGKWRMLNRGYYIIWGTLSLLICTACTTLPYWFGYGLSWHEFAISTICIGFCTAALVYLYKKEVTSAAFMLIATSFFFYTTFFGTTLPRIHSFWITERVVDSLKNAHYSPSVASPLLSTDYHEPSLIFRLGTHQVRFISTADLVSAAKTHASFFLLIKQNEEKLLQKVPQNAKLINRIEGVHYSKGKHKSYLLYSMQPKSKVPKTLSPSS